MEVTKTFKLALVAGKSQQLPALQLFSRFGRIPGFNLEVRVHAFLGSVPEAMRGCGFAFNLYELDPSRPGFMAGLEEQLSGSDLIVGAGAENLSTFQALRASLKLAVPFHVISFDQAPNLFDDFLNIRAVRHDVLSRCKVIWATGERSSDVLEFEGYGKDRVMQLPLTLDHACVPLESRRREKFRSHVGIASGAFVVLFRGALDAKGAAGELVKSLHAIRVSGHPQFDRVVALFCGERDGSDPLKYMISDWHLSSHARILHQDPAEFLVDLMNASDVVVDSSAARTSESNLNAAIARMAGAVPVISSAQACGGWGVADGCGVVPEVSSIPLAKAIRKVLDDGLERHEIRAAFIEISAAADGSQFEGAILRDLRGSAVDVTGAGQPGRENVRENMIESLVVKMEAEAHSIKTEDTLLAAEDLLLRAPSPMMIARINLVKGSVLFTAGNYEAATEAYRSALMSMHVIPSHDQAPHSRALVSTCYRGLGNVAAAVQSHKEALDLYRRALALDPQDGLTCAGIGNVYRRLRLYEESLHWLAKSAVAMPGDESALTRFSQAALECPEKSMAARALSEVVQVLGDHPSLARAMDALEVKID
jgi:tetratricopeptide (TPR) repeat protein